MKSKPRVAMIATYPAREVLAEEDLRRKFSEAEHASSWVRSLCSALAKRDDIEFKLFALRRAVRRRIKVRHLGFDLEFLPQWWPARFDTLLRYLPNAAILWPSIRRYGPDIVHGFGLETGNALIASYYPFRATAFIQGIVEEYGKENMCCLPEREYARRLQMERCASKRMCGMVAESEFAHRWASTASKNAIIRIIPHAVNPEFMEAGTSDQVDPAFVTVGRIDHRKGIDVIIRALASMKSVSARLIVIGDGPSREYCASLAMNLGIGSRVEFMGNVDRNSVIQTLLMSRVFVFPSRMDTSPNAITEAHAIGLPVIASRVGGIPDMIDDGKDGILIDADDVAGFSGAMSRLIGDPDLCRGMGRAGRDKVQLLNSPDRVAEAHVRFFQDVAAIPFRRL